MLLFKVDFDKILDNFLTGFVLGWQLEKLDLLTGNQQFRLQLSRWNKLVSSGWVCLRMWRVLRIFCHGCMISFCAKMEPLTSTLPLYHKHRRHSKREIVKKPSKEFGAEDFDTSNGNYDFNCSQDFRLTLSLWCIIFDFFEHRRNTRAILNILWHLCDNICTRWKFRRWWKSS